MFINHLSMPTRPTAGSTGVIQSTISKGGKIMSTFTELEKMLSTGRISRREFLAGVSAIGLTAAVSPAFLPSTARADGLKKAVG